MQKLAVRPRFVKRLLFVSVALVILVSAIGQTVVRAVNTSETIDLDWATPTNMALHRTGALGTTQSQPNFLSNLDCTPLTYRMVSQTTMQDGCFTPTAFGMLDSSNQTIIFNGTDEGLSLASASPHQVLAPWPQALNLLTLDAVGTGGSYLGMYTNPVAHMQDQRDYLGRLTGKRLTGKRLTGPPDILFRDSSGQRLVINAQTLAFSQGGSWLVAETLGGSFVRINLATLEMTAFAPHFGTQSSGGLLLSRVAVSDDGRFVAIENNVADSFKVYDLDTCDGVVRNLRPENCLSHDYRPFVKQRIGGLWSIQRLRFINDSLLRFDAWSSDATASGAYVLAPTDSIASMTDYIALGDSYTSGEGAFSYLAGSDTDDNQCHVSTRSYPMLLTRDLFSPAGGHSIACSGAVINDVGSSKGSYRGQVKQGASFDELSRDPAKLERIKADFSPGHLSQQRFVRHYQPRIVTVSIGGNDIGFGDLLQRCVMPHISRHISDSTCYNTYESRQEVVQLVDRTIPRWTALYRQLQASNPGGQIYAIGYPSIASDLGACGTNVSLGKSELAFAEELLAYLNGAIAQAAMAAHVSYVDIGQALHGHRLCEAAGSAVAVNGLTAGKDSGPFGIGVLGRESYHPNALGHQLIAQAILRQTTNLTSRSLTASPESSANNLLNAPKSGRAINRLAPDNSIAPPVLRSDNRFTVKVDGARNGLKPNTSYTIRLDGASGPLLATISSNSDGDIAADIILAAHTTPGGHSIDVFGSGQDNRPVNVTQPVYVSASYADPDGDSLNTAADTCPYAINSSQDTDHDGIDDICDPLIGTLNSPVEPAIDPKSPAAPSPDNPQRLPNHLPQPHASSDSLAGLASAQTSIPRSGLGILQSVVLSASSALPKRLPEPAARQSQHYRPAARPQAPFERIYMYVLLVTSLILIIGAVLFALRKRQHEHI